MLDFLVELSGTIKLGSQCAFGMSAPGPLLGLINYFRDAFEEHIIDRHCPSGLCKAPLTYHLACPIYPGVALTARAEPRKIEV